MSPDGALPLAGQGQRASDHYQPVVRGVALCLVHVPDLVRYGSKPSREIVRDHSRLDAITSHLRTYDQAVAYLPNQVFIGNTCPEQLWHAPAPWSQNLIPNAGRFGPHGEIMPGNEFYALMKAWDDFDLVWLRQEFVASVRPLLEVHPLIEPADIQKLGAGRTTAEIARRVNEQAALPLYYQGSPVGCISNGYPDDPSLSAQVLLENLAAKASAALALRHVVRQEASVVAADIDYLLGCGEEAVGDRYQRGGGNLAKAIGETAHCTHASGSDVKAFCCAPLHAIVLAAALVKAGLFSGVAVVGGGSLAKLGMKHEGHLKHNMPILEDVLAAVAVIVGRDDGRSPVIDLSCVGKHEISAQASQEAIASAIVLTPLRASNLKLTDIDRFATELHNPEITEPQGTGNVPQTNYRILAMLAVKHGEIAPEQVGAFVQERGMPGFSPTQGHIASAVPYLGHARDKLVAGEIARAFFYAKGSLFLGRMTQLSDGISVLLRRNPQLSERGQPHHERTAPNHQ